MEAPLITDTVSHRTVLKKLGGGGQPEDYLAEGTVLNRRLDKALPGDFASDQQPKSQLIQNAQVAGLDHAPTFAQSTMSAKMLVARLRRHWLQLRRDEARV